MENIIEIEGLEKSFSDVKAVNNISFKVKKGELFAFLGVNGAGKSTTINIICGDLKKDSGSVVVGGYNIESDLDKIKKCLGVVFQGSVLDSALSVRDNLESRAALYGIFGKKFEEKLTYLSKLLDFEGFTPVEHIAIEGFAVDAINTRDKEAVTPTSKAISVSDYAQ